MSQNKIRPLLDYKSKQVCKNGYLRFVLHFYVRNLIFQIFFIQIRAYFSRKTTKVIENDRNGSWISFSSR